LALQGQLPSANGHQIDELINHEEPAKDFGVSTMTARLMTLVATASLCQSRPSRLQRLAPLGTGGESKRSKAKKEGRAPKEKPKANQSAGERHGRHKDKKDADKDGAKRRRQMTRKREGQGSAEDKDKGCGYLRSLSAFRRFRLNRLKAATTSVPFFS